MFAQILNRSWKLAPEQAAVVINDELTRRKVLFRGAAIGLGAFLAGCANWNGNVATLTQTIVDYVTNIASALGASVTGLANIAGLPAGWATTLTSIATWVANIKSVAAGITTSTLVSAATGGITAVIGDFNQIVQSIISSPVVSAAVSATGFGWALSAASILLPLIEQAVDVVINIVSPPSPAPVPASTRMGARLTAPLDPNTANLILQEIAARGGVPGH